MEDPRIILQNELIKVGIKHTDAHIISLDAGSSQVVVNREYLSDFEYSKQIRKVALSVVIKFYTGELFEEVDE